MPIHDGLSFIENLIEPGCFYLNLSFSFLYTFENSGLEIIQFVQYHKDE